MTFYWHLYVIYSWIVINVYSFKVPRHWGQATITRPSWFLYSELSYCIGGAKECNLWISVPGYMQNNKIFPNFVHPLAKIILPHSHYALIEEAIAILPLILYFLNHKQSFRHSWGSFQVAQCHFRQGQRRRMSPSGPWVLQGNSIKHLRQDRSVTSVFCTHLRNVKEVLVTRISSTQVSYLQHNVMQ